MQIIEIAEPIDHSKIFQGDVVLALGFFDGIHCGHQAVIKQAYKQAKAKNLKLAVMTFDRYPKMLFQKIDPQQVRYLTMIKRRSELLENLGVDILYVARFDQKLAQLSPQAFVDKFIVGLNAKVVVAGFDYTFGKPDVANIDTLPNFAEGRFETIKVSKLIMQNVKVGTTKIKQLLNQGAIDDANELLGYPFTFYGKVVHGKQRGRTLGFPTLNIETDPHQQILGVGIYAVKVNVKGHWYQGMASISHNETFGNNPLTIEINLFDFNQMIYGQEVKIEWNHYLRAPIKFESVDSLIEQLKKDKQATIQYFDRN